MSLATAVTDQLDAGSIKVVPLIKIELPNKTVAYHYGGGRDFDYGGLIYKGNKWIQPESFDGALGNDISIKSLIFSGVKEASATDDAIAEIEDYDYLNAPVTISYICGDPETDEPLGVLLTDFYEIDNVLFETGELQDDGSRELTVQIDIEPIGRRVRDKSHAKRSDDQQKYDNDATDTAFEYAAASQEWAEEWGQR